MKKTYDKLILQNRFSFDSTGAYMIHDRRPFGKVLIRNRWVEVHEEFAKAPFLNHEKRLQQIK
jgi:hypothetical protein